MIDLFTEIFVIIIIINDDVFDEFCSNISIRDLRKIETNLLEEF